MNNYEEIKNMESHKIYKNNLGITTSIKLNKSNKPEGNVNVILTNSDPIFSRPIIYWYEECNHIDRLALSNVKPARNKDKRHLLSLNEHNTSWLNIFSDIFKF